MVSIDASTSASSAGTTELSFPLTIGAGAQRALVVTVMTRGNPEPTSASGVTYDGAALFSVQTAVSENVGADNYEVQFFALAAPPVGTADVVISFGSATPVVAGAISFFGADQTIVAESAGSVSQDDLLEVYVATAADVIIDAMVATTSSGPSPAGRG